MKNIQKVTNQNENFVTVPFQIFQMLKNLLVLFQNLVIFFTIRSYQNKRTGTNADPDHFVFR